MMYPNEIHLLVSHVSYQMGGQLRFGVGSHFLCVEAEIEKTPIPIYIQMSNHFTLPEDPETPIIMIGPGTGVAPFRAFLQERLASQAGGKNWLFFGECHRKTDYYYESFFEDLKKQGRLRLDLAFSRDTSEKVYVQHKMWEERKSLFSWIEEGAIVYVCGDAKVMAKDVDQMLNKVIQKEGKLSETKSQEYLRNMRKEKRYRIDVY
jgi:sulfite reductase (NADPH) flavoprotein alpha-component